MTGLAKGLRGNRDARDLRAGDVISVARLGNMTRAEISGVTVLGDVEVVVSYRTLRGGFTGSLRAPASDRFTVLPRS